MNITYLQFYKFHKLIHHRKLLSALLYYYYNYDKKYFKQIMYSKYKNKIFIMRLIINLVEYLYEDYIGFFNMMSDNLIYSSLKNTPEFTNKHIFQLITDIFKDY